MLAGGWDRRVEGRWWLTRGERNTWREGEADPAKRGDGEAGSERGAGACRAETPWLLSWGEFHQWQNWIQLQHQ